ncbi:MAG TPA: GNAT family N-acetyltransferase [Gaiellaceae bacterium]
MTVHLEPWSEDDLPLLEQTLGDPAMMTYLGGPESPEQLVARQAKFVALPSTGGGEMFTVVDDESGTKVGSVGWWDKEWRDDVVYETGWQVIPAFQGRGIATAAMVQLIEQLKAGGGSRRFLHAFPSVENGPSNAICRKLGFDLLEALEFEYPKGSIMRCNDWRLDLRA